MLLKFPWKNEINQPFLPLFDKWLHCPLIRSFKIPCTFGLNTLCFFHLEGIILQPAFTSARILTFVDFKTSGRGVTLGLSQSLIITLWFEKKISYSIARKSIDISLGKRSWLSDTCSTHYKLGFTKLRKEMIPFCISAKVFRGRGVCLQFNFNHRSGNQATEKRPSTYKRWW